MAIAILATGNEVVTGDTLNTNAHAIANTLQSEGFEVRTHLTSTDDKEDIINHLKYLGQNHEMIIILGGLGPTSDDRTRFAVSEWSSQELEEFPEAIEHIHAFLQKFNRELTPSNRQQALFPTHTNLLPNPYGTALGGYCKINRKLHVALLPGPPSECLPMFMEHLLPILRKKWDKTDFEILKWRLFWIAESQIADSLDMLLRDLDCETGYRLESPYLECKVRCHRKEALSIQALVTPFLAPYIIASTEQRATEALAEYLSHHNLSIAIEDRATGGVLQTLIQNPSNYKKITFRHHKKKADFTFTIKGLKRFWNNEKTGEYDEIIIEYSHKNKHHEEKNRLLFRNRNILHAASEWLAFKMLDIINQLHQ